MNKCKKCIKGIIMKQIAIGEYVPEPCDCYVNEECKRYGGWFINVRANP